MGILRNKYVQLHRYFKDGFSRVPIRKYLLRILISDPRIRKS